MLKIQMINILILIIGFIFGTFYAVMLEKVSKENNKKIKMNTKIFGINIPVKYLMIQFLTISVFLILFNSVNPFTEKNNLFGIFESKILILIFMPIYISLVYLIGIYEIYTKKISKNLLAVLIGVSAVYSVLEYIITKNLYIHTNLWNSVLYLVILIMFSMLQMVRYTKKKEIVYFIDLLMYMLILAIFISSKIIIYSLPLIITVYALILISKIFKKNEKVKKSLRKAGLLKVKQLGKEKVKNIKSKYSKYLIPLTPVVGGITIAVYIYGLYILSY